MSLFGRIAASIGRLIGIGQQASSNQSQTETDVEVTTTTYENQPPTTVPTDEETSYTAGGGYIFNQGESVEYIEGYKDRYGLVLPRWRIGHEGGNVPERASVRDLLNAIPSWPAFTVGVGGTRTNPYPNKPSTHMYLSFRVLAHVLYDALKDPDTMDATSFVNYFAEGQDSMAGWDEVEEIFIVDRQPDAY